jgi:hypothetical protein
VFKVLEGKTVNLRIVEKEDLPLLTEWLNSLDCISGYNPFRQRSKAEQERDYEKLGPDEKWFFIEKKDGGKIGFTMHFAVRGYSEIGYASVPKARVRTNKLSLTSSFFPRLSLEYFKHRYA